MELSTRQAPWVLLAALLAAAGTFHYTRNHLEMHTDTADMLSERLAFRQTYEEFKTAFPQLVDTLLVVVEAPIPEQVRRAAEDLRAVLVRDTAHVTEVYWPAAEPFFRRQALLYESPEALERLTDRLALAQPLLARLGADASLITLAETLVLALDADEREGALDLQPVHEAMVRTLRARLDDAPRALSWERLLRAEEEAPARELLMVRPVLDYSRLFAGEAAMAAVRRHAEALGLRDGVGARAYVTGSVALADEELHSAMDGARRAALLAVVMVALALYFALGTLRLVLAALAALLFGLVFTAGFAAAAIGHLNLISIAFAVLYIGLGIDYGIHFLLRYREARQSGSAHLPAMRSAGDVTGRALVLCAFTTAIGFYAFVPTAFSGVSELGLISGTGMFISLGVTLTVLPALLGVGPPPRMPAPSASPCWRLTELPERFPRTVRRGTVVLAAGALVTLPQVRFDSNPLNLRDPAGEAVATFRTLLEDGETSPWHISVLAADAEAALGSDGALRGLPPVRKVVDVFDLVPELQEEKLSLIDTLALTLGPGVTPPAPGLTARGTASQRAALETLHAALVRHLATTSSAQDRDATRALASELARLLARLDPLAEAEGAALLDAVGSDLLGTLPDSLQRLSATLDATPFGLQELPADVRARWLSDSGAYRLAVFPVDDVDDEASLGRFVDAVRRVAPGATGAPVLNLAAGEAVVEAFVRAFALALGGVALVLLVVLRSVRYTVLALAPLLLAAMLTASATVLLDLPFNFANVIALPLLLGIGIDNGIHLIQRHREGDRPSAELLRSSTTRAIFYSALTTVVSFGNLAFSPHRGTASMGLLLSIGVLLTLVSTLVVLPALLGPSRGRPA